MGGRGVGADVEKKRQARITFFPSSSKNVQTGMALTKHQQQTHRMQSTCRNDSLQVCRGGGMWRQGVTGNVGEGTEIECDFGSGMSVVKGHFGHSEVGMGV